MEAFIVAVIIASIVLNILLIKKIKKMHIDYENYIADADRRYSAEILDIRNKTEDRLKSMQMYSDNEIQKERERAEKEIANEKVACEQKLREMKEFIESRRKVLMTESEKSLLVDVVMALEGYGGRLERIEEKLVVEKINEDMLELTEKLERKTNQIICSIERKLDDVNKNINEILSSADVTEEIEIMNADIDNIKNMIIEIENEISDDYSRRSLREVISETQTRIDNIYYAVDEVKDKVSFNYFDGSSLRDKLDEIKDGIDSMRSGS